MIRKGAGSLRHFVQLQSPTRTQGTYGQSKPSSWTVYAKTYAAIEPLAGAERLAADQVTPTTSHRIRIRYRTDLQRDHRIVFNSRTFEISSVIDVDERHEELEILAAEKVT